MLARNVSLSASCIIGHQNKLIFKEFLALLLVGGVAADHKICKYDSAEWPPSCALHSHQLQPRLPGQAGGRVKTRIDLVGDRWLCQLRVVWSVGVVRVTCGAGAAENLLRGVGGVEEGAAAGAGVPVPRERAQGGGAEL